MNSSGPSLPILQPQDVRSHSNSPAQIRRASGRWAIAVHAVRMLLVLLVIFSGYRVHQRRVAQSRKPIESQWLLSFAQRVWPNATRCTGNSTSDLLVDVVDSNEKPLGIIATTSPLADSVIGYAGPSNVILGISLDGVVQRVELVSSSDTPDHVLMVRNDDRFWRQFEGRSWANAPQATRTDSIVAESRPDAVSGATLTSLAIAESILLRIGSAGDTQSSAESISGTRTSLKFADPLTESEAMQLVAEASKQFPEEWDPERVTLTTVSPWEFSIVDGNAKVIGRVLRSGPLSDQIVGYQGPSEVLFCLNSEQTLLVASFRNTFDNQPYSRYVKDEASYWSKFSGRKLSELASVDFTDLGVEGVSGATMTSLAVAETIQESCKQLLELERKAKSAPEVNQNARASASVPARWWNLSWNELLTIAIASVALPWSRYRYRGRAGVRRTWQVVSFLGLGWVSGNMLSLALFTGWTQSGIPWQLAPGLVAILLVTCVSNLFFKRNVYCDHICPHGIAQQWLQKLPTRNRIQSTTTKERWILGILRSSGVLAVGLAIAQLAFGWSIPVARFEPFDAYIWRIGFSWSAAVWVVTLTYSYYRPMAYCRHGCPTGKLLNYTRFNASRSRVSIADFMLVLVVFAFAVL